MDCPTPPFAAVPHLIIERLQADPYGCAIRFRGRTINNNSLLRTVLALSERLHAAGVGAGTRTGLCLERVPALPALLLALWWRGAVYVPIDPALPRERLMTMCEVAAIDLLITQEELRLVVETLPCPALILGTDNFDAEQQPSSGICANAVPLTASSLAYVLFTSGSSGMPKGVRINHGNLAGFFSGALPLLGLGLAGSCRILGCANFSFDISLFELLAPLLCGGTLVLADASVCESPVELLNLIVQEQVDVVQATPSHWQLLNSLHWPTSIAIALSIGEALMRDTAAAILRHASVLWNVYGPTECTIWSSAYRVTAQDLGESAPAIVSIGTALPGYTLRLAPITGDDGASAEELIIGGVGVSPGYCATTDDAAFAQDHAAPSYRSGDLCRCDRQGRFHYSGRRDDQVKHNGYRIEPEEIALLLRKHMSIRRAACLVRPASADRPGLLIACVVFRHGMPKRNKAGLNEYLASYLPEWMLPQRYLFLDALPLTTNGKLDRQALIALTDPVEARTTYDSLEAQVAAIFCEVLEVTDIGPCDSFLDAGGSSMLVATLVMTLNERLGGVLTLRQALATPPTVAGIVQLLRTGPHNNAS